MGKPVQIDSEELALYKAGHGMLEKLYADPDEGIGFKKLIKKKFPLAQVPDLEAVSAAEKMFKPLQDRLDNYDKERAKEKEDSLVKDLQTRFDRIAKDHGLTEEGQKKLLGIMKDRSIGNPEDAIVIFEKDLPKPERNSKPYSSRMNFVTSDGEKDSDFHKLMNDPDAFMVDGMVTALEEMKKDR
jgi:hypothetical protein